VQLCQLNSTFHVYSAIGLLTLLAIIDSPLLHVTAVSIKRITSA